MAAWLVGETPETVEEVDTALIAAEARFTDKLLRLRFTRRPDILLHLEFQVEGDLAMPDRMAEYLALLLRALRSKESPCQPASVVIYLDRRTYRDDPGKLEVRGALETEILVRYKVIRMWEVDPAALLERGGPGLWPFAPLARGNPVELLLKSSEKITRAPESQVSPEAKRDLLMILGGLAARVIKDRGLIARILSEIRLMGENIFFDMIREEGMALGIEKGRAEGRGEGQRLGALAEARRAVLLVLARRFGDVPGEIRSFLDGVGALEVLEGLLERAITCASLEEFRSDPRSE